MTPEMQQALRDALDQARALFTPQVMAWLPWALAGAMLLLAIMLLWRGSGAAALRRQLTEFDRDLRRDIANETRAGLAAAFEQMLRGNEAMQGVLGAFRVQVSDTLERSGTEGRAALELFGRQQATQLEAMGRMLREADERTQRGLAEQRDFQASRLQAGFEAFGTALREEQERLRGQVAARLDEIRAAVDEKLTAALEKQVGESFQRVTEQFAEVQKAIGQVQSVAAQIGDLKRLFSNVKSRGGWGEAQVGFMLGDALPEGSFASDMRLREGSAEVVEYALRVPIKGGPEVWLAIDAKFPTEDYDRLLLAADSGSRDDEAAARRGLEQRIRLEGRRIAEKYILPPKTVDFAVLYVPTDGLFAEIARTPGLIEQVRRDHRVMIMGPSLLPAFLHTIRVGHLTMALERKAAEIGDTLRAVKTEWDKLGGSLDTLAARADLLTRGIDDTRRRTRAVGRKLRGFDALEGPRAEELLGLEPAALAEVEDAAE